MDDPLGRAFFEPMRNLRRLTSDPFAKRMARNIEMSDRYVNGIPTGYRFKKSLWRTGIAGGLKKAEPQIDAIYEALKEAETFRNIYTTGAIHRLRDVRYLCYKAKNNYIEFQKDLEGIQKLSLALSAQIEAIALRLSGPSNRMALQPQDMAGYGKFQSFYDNVSMKHGGGVGRTLGAGYQNERFGLNNNGNLTSAWVNSGTKMGIQAWVDTVYLWDQQDGASRSADQSIIAIGPQGVRYLDVVDRLDYFLDLSGGVARLSDPGQSLAHTGGFVSKSGVGWGIYTVGFHRNMYLGEHITGEFHHSSFFSGAPVLAAGEIMVNRGRVVGLTNKTGHYKAGPAELAEALKVLRVNGVNVHNVAVTDPFRAEGKFYHGDEVLAANGDLTNMGAPTMQPPPPLA